jgi:hypothetical protein
MRIERDDHGVGVSRLKDSCVDYAVTSILSLSQYAKNDRKK